MNSNLTELCRYFAAASRAGQPLALATTIRTEGSTYRKAGARILVARDGTSSGLLSGGCLEADLLERAVRVMKSGRAERIVFDTTGSDDLIWGLGLGCEGVTEVWLQPATRDNGYAPLPYLRRCLEQERDGAVATVIGGEALPSELGRHGYTRVDSDDSLYASDPLHAGDSLSACLGEASATQPSVQTMHYLGRILEVFVAPVTLPPALLLCGGGPDAVPVARLADSLGWRVTVVDHRPAFAVATNFPESARIILARAEDLADRLCPSKFNAAVIMSHHLPSDVEYCRQLATSPPHYIGLLGPASRRARLCREVGTAMHAISDRIYGPVGLNIGANTPASIALSIIAQIHAVLTGQRDAVLVAR
jgi:xanthine dehydrogenase accessory factor